MKTKDDIIGRVLLVFTTLLAYALGAFSQHHDNSRFIKQLFAYVLVIAAFEFVFYLVRTLKSPFSRKK